MKKNSKEEKEKKKFAEDFEEQFAKAIQEKHRLENLYDYTDEEYIDIIIEELDIINHMIDIIKRKASLYKTQK